MTLLPCSDWLVWTWAVLTTRRCNETFWLVLCNQSGCVLISWSEYIGCQKPMRA